MNTEEFSLSSDSSIHFHLPMARPGSELSRAVNSRAALIRKLWEVLNILSFILDISKNFVRIGHMTRVAFCTCVLRSSDF